MRSRRVGISMFLVIFVVLFAIGAIAVVNRPEQIEFRTGIGVDQRK